MYAEIIIAVLSLVPIPFLVWCLWKVSRELRRQRAVCSNFLFVAGSSEFGPQHSGEVIEIDVARERVHSKAGKRQRVDLPGRPA
jgi:hypothetical protein